MTRPLRESGGPRLPQFSLRGVLVVVSVVCVISTLFPWTGVVLAAFLPAIIGFTIIRYALLVNDDVKFAVGLGLVTFGYIAGSVILVARGNLINQ